MVNVQRAAIELWIQKEVIVTRKRTFFATRQRKKIIATNSILARGKSSVLPTDPLFTLYFSLVTKCNARSKKKAS